MLKCSEPTYRRIGPELPFCRLLAAAAARFFSACINTGVTNGDTWIRQLWGSGVSRLLCVQLRRSLPERPEQWWGLLTASGQSTRSPAVQRKTRQTRCKRCPLTSGSFCQRWSSHLSPADRGPPLELVPRQNRLILELARPFPQLRRNPPGLELWFWQPVAYRRRYARLSPLESDYQLVV